MVQIPQWFANRYTGGDTLGVGFGGYFSIVSTASFGPALAAIAAPDPAVNPDDSSLANIPLIGYPTDAPDRAHRDTNTPATMTAGLSNHAWQVEPGQRDRLLDLERFHLRRRHMDRHAADAGRPVHRQGGPGNVYYQASDRHAQSGAFEWMVYNPADLAAVASGAKQQWQIQPEYEWTTPTLPLGRPESATDTPATAQPGRRRGVRPDDQPLVRPRGRGHRLERLEA